MYKPIGQPRKPDLEGEKETPASVLNELEIEKREFENLLLAIRFDRKRKLHYFLVFLLALATLATTFSLFSFAIVEADVGVTFLSFRLIFSIFSWVMVFFSIFSWNETMDGEINHMNHGYYEFYRVMTIVNGGWLGMLVIFGWSIDIGSAGCPAPFCSVGGGGPVRFEYWFWFLLVHLMLIVQLLLLASMNGLRMAFEHRRKLTERERVKAMFNVLLKVLNFIEQQIASNKQAFIIIIILLCGTMVMFGIAFLSLSIPIADSWNTWQWYRMLFPSVIGIFIYYSTRTWYSTLAVYRRDFGGRYNSGHSALLIIYCFLLLVPLGWSLIVDIILNGCPTPLCSVAGGFPIRWEYLLWLISTSLALILAILLVVFVGIANRLVHDAFLNRMMFDKPSSLNYTQLEMQLDYAGIANQFNTTISGGGDGGNQASTISMGTQYEYNTPLMESGAVNLELPGQKQIVDAVKNFTRGGSSNSVASHSIKTD